MKKIERPYFVPLETSLTEEFYSNGKIDFSKIEKRIKAKKALFESEKNFYCQHYNAFSAKTSVEDYATWANWNFKKTYLIYWRDISGGSIYTKPDETFIQKQSLVPDLEDVRQNPHKYKIQVPIEQVQEDIKYLMKEAQEWERQIQSNNSEELIAVVFQEVKKQIEELNKSLEIKNIPYIKGSFFYKQKKASILLQSKYAYLMSIEESEGKSLTESIINLNGCEIQFNALTMMHILSRHYSNLTKQHLTDTSFFTDFFHYKYFLSELKQLCTIIDESGIYKNDSFEKISFKFKGIIYCVRVSPRKYIRQDGLRKKAFHRIKTFYPVHKPSELQTLTLDYHPVSINPNFEVFCKK